MILCGAMRLGWIFVVVVATAPLASADGLAIESEGWIAHGVQGLAASSDGKNVRVAVRYVWNPCRCTQLRFGASIGSWFGIAPYGNPSNIGPTSTNWTVATFSAETTWLVLTDHLRVGPELAVTPPSVGASSRQAPLAVSLGARLRYDDVSLAVAFEHAWPPLPDEPYPYNRASNSITAGIGFGGKPGLVAAGVLALAGLIALVPYHDN